MKKGLKTKRKKDKECIGSGNLKRKACFPGRYAA